MLDRRGDNMSRWRLPRDRWIACHFLLLFSVLPAAAGAQIPRPEDAPAPQTPEESLRQIRLPAGFALELVASEPLVREPSVMCWDERGRLFVGELHGYNLEGQYDIEELNRTGELDRVVRRIQANPRAKERALQETYGTIKLLLDTDGDGECDQAKVWADRVPPCLGICPARGGLIVVGSPQIVFLADRDGDDRAEVREVLFDGFPVGPLERGLSACRWGPDHWIYVANSNGGATVTEPALPRPVELPGTDFRFRADGSAIEPVVGVTHTVGHTFDRFGDRYVVSTGTPAIQVAPLHWHLLAANPDLHVGNLTRSAVAGSRAFPISRPHPWRQRRADDPGFSEFYSQRYGIEEAAPNGFFTSACSPFIYRDDVLPGLQDQLFACEPAQNFVFRGEVRWNGLHTEIRRPEAEANREFLASADVWFHPIYLTHGPEGAIYLVDFYREIIEDYSAIPRYLQQQYGLINGQDRGRIWRLVHREMNDAPLGRWDPEDTPELVAAVADPLFWRRETARRLLLERRSVASADGLRTIVRNRDAFSQGRVNALYTLDGLERLDPETLAGAMHDSALEVRLHACRIAAQRLVRDELVTEALMQCTEDPDVRVRLQAVQALGGIRDVRVPEALAEVAREDAGDEWMRYALVAASADRKGAFLQALLHDEPAPDGELLEMLCAALAASRNEIEIGRALVSIGETPDADLRRACLRGLQRGLGEPLSLALDERARAALQAMRESPDERLRLAAHDLYRRLRLETAAERTQRRRELLSRVVDPALAPIDRVGAVEELAGDPGEEVVDGLVVAVVSGTPRVRQAALNGLFSRPDRAERILDEIEAERLPTALLQGSHRLMLLEHPSTAVANRARRVFESAAEFDSEQFRDYVAALREATDPQRGAQSFVRHCATCHMAHGVGAAVGPDLTAESGRAPETMVLDVLAPSSVLSPGYATYLVETRSGRLFSGILAAESASSVTLVEPGGKFQVLLRRDIDRLHVSRTSLMPAELHREVSPDDLADIILWLRQPTTIRVLFDDHASIVDHLSDGGGQAQLVSRDTYHGSWALEIQPLQRYSARIPGWSFRIREHPAPGEFRYVRFAWKSVDAKGAMIEWADGGSWPAADSPRCRYVAGLNVSDWSATVVSAEVPREWTVVTRDLWGDFGDCELTGMAPTALGGTVLFDRIELLRHLD